MTRILTLTLLAALLAAPAVVRAEDGAKGLPKAACKADVEKFCKDVTPGEGRLLACLKAHDDQLSAECKAAGEKAKSRRAERREAVKEFKAACDQDREKLCKGATGRAAMACFREHRDELSEGCRAELEKGKKRFLQAHPKMAAAIEACEADKAKFCGGVEPGEGRIIACMKQHQSELSEGCRAAMGHKRKAEKAPQGEDKEY